MINLCSLRDALHEPSAQSFVGIDLPPLLFDVATELLLGQRLPPLHSLLEKTPQIFNWPKIGHLGSLEIMWNSALKCQTCLKSSMTSETKILMKKGLALVESINECILNSLFSSNLSYLWIVALSSCQISFSFPL